MLPAMSVVTNADGGNVPVVVMFKKDQGDIAGTIKQPVLATKPAHAACNLCSLSLL
jgi:hypothetical protein